MGCATAPTETTPLIPKAESNKSSSANPRTTRLTARGVITVSSYITNEKLSSFFNQVNDKISGSRLDKSIGKNSVLQRQVMRYVTYRSDLATNSDKK